MAERQIAPYGSWESPITVQMVSSSGIRLGQVEAAGGDVLWQEGRPLEGGRGAVVRRNPEGLTTDAVPSDRNVRTRVHEYGGGSFAAFDDGVFFADFDDQRLYRTVAGGSPVPITPEPEIPAGDRYADLDFLPDGDSFFCVRERHRAEGEPVNELIWMPADGSAEPVVVAAGNDFYSTPRVDPDGTRLAWLTWHHPQMPWDGTELWVADVAADGRISGAEQIAGGVDESIFQPEWSPEGELHFVSDRTGWWNLYAVADTGIVPRYPAEAEFGVPQWLFRFRRFAFLGDGRIACVVEQGGFDELAVLEGSELRALAPRLTVFAAQLAVSGGRIWAVAGSSSTPMAVVAVDPDTGDVEVVRESESIAVDPSYISMPEAIEFPTSQDRTAHAFYYPPQNPGFIAPEGERPPLLVVSHGGPTAANKAELALGYQFWTSRGIAVVDVNYSGSTGYGRAYRDRLQGTWGVVDTEDCVNAARFLADRGSVDGSRMAIRGGSAGGYCTLCALAFHDTFAAGASYFGVGDLEALAKFTHKFESRYLDGLVGPYPAEAARYRERSPVHHADQISCPVILFQGLEDAVVPPSQAEEMVAALDASGLAHAYLAFEGEQHGFRKAENIERSREAELSFYAQIFGFEPAGSVAPVAIVNL